MFGIYVVQMIETMRSLITQVCKQVENVNLSHTKPGLPGRKIPHQEQSNKSENMYSRCPLFSKSNPLKQEKTTTNFM